jgi:murein DD-endopeptidase MepM/ murein hydrolase activator NlpD
MKIVIRLALFMASFVLANPAYSHCKWRHPHHCVTEPVKKVVKEAERVEKRVEKEINRTDENLHDIVKDVGKGTENAVRDTRDFSLHVITEVGEEFEEFICGLAGKEPTQEDGCNVNAGAEVNSDGEVTATDGQGNPSDKPLPPVNEESDKLAWLKKVELQDWEQSTKDERYIIGGLLMLAPVIPTDITWFVQLPSSPTSSGDIRVASQGVQQLVGARRIDNDGTARLHRGTDYNASPGDDTYASFDGEVIATGVMTNKPFNYVHIKSANGVVQRNLYVNSNLNVGDKVIKGEVIGYADNLHVESGYPTSVTNHIHVEYRTPEGHSLAPNGKYLVAKEQGNAADLCENNKCFSPSTE